MNVAPPHWASFFPKARHPVTPALTGAFDVPRDVPPPPLQMLLRQLDHARRAR